MSPDLTKAYAAAFRGDVNALEEMRDRINPGLPLYPSAPTRDGSFTLLEVSLFVGFGIHDEKGPSDIDATDNTAYWLIQRSLEMGDKDILTRRLFDNSVSPMNRALNMLCPRAVLLLLEHGVDADVNAKASGGQPLIGCLVNQSVVPDKSRRIESIVALVQDFHRVQAARAIINEIDATPALAP